ncbi:transposase [Bradyrhizobium hipponense]|uniref:Transposase n=1 Tax=Bradyrhizobium hipponense TaxID=2605638 RepID=A0A5S4YTF0_9BRAD|nr:transposase [Bradyrhizobium hipponense]
MDDHSDDIRRPSPRIEVYTGAGRKRWPDDLKAQIAAESFEPGAIVTDVARRHGCRPQQVHDWRRRARLGQLVLPASADTLSFVPLVSESSHPRLRSPPYRRKQLLLRSSSRVHGLRYAGRLALRC